MRIVEVFLIKKEELLLGLLMKSWLGKRSYVGPSTTVKAPIRLNMQRGILGILSAVGAKRDLSHRKKFY